MSDFLRKLGERILNRTLNEALKKIFSDKEKQSKKEEDRPQPAGESVLQKSHPWRLCPSGEHWIRTHPLTVPANNQGPEKTTTRHGHCRMNSGKAECYTADEFREIAERCFEQLKDDPETMPVPHPFKFPNGNKYDTLIAGWTKFWNETLDPKEPLSPDFIKALIATESSFEILPDTPSDDGAARGLIQITENTRKILQNRKGELRNHYIEMTAEESREPEVNLGAGIRWLHHKKYLAEHRLKREITWEEAAAEYKGILPQLGKHAESDDIMRKLKKYHGKLQGLRSKNE